MTISVRGLVVSDGRRDVVAGVDLDVLPGAVTAVIGANGAGKSELVLALAGVMPVKEGSILLDGAPLPKGPEAIRRAGVAAIPEGHRVLTQLSVEDNLRVAGTLLPDGLAERLEETWAIFPELAERKGQLAGTLSGGQQQMVALAHALMCRPRFLLIDEMSLGLAPLIVKRLLGVVASLKERGVGILLIEQFTDLALGMADQAVVLRSGQMRYSGPARRLVDDQAVLHQAYFAVT
ncbi:MAG: ATP-binding cassette domain-containing protein [Rhodobacter sp.]|jgi:branched-chain amino acid transport system ATP-binding protein|nr:ATP-binding cassette domain-containing protein [Rhodobacter sp.]